MEKITKSKTLTLQSSEDVVRVRNEVRLWMKEKGFRLIHQTRMATAVSELARNAVDYGGGGVAHLQLVANGLSEGIRVTIEDQGPGISDLEQAMQDGFTTGSGLGLGLSGSKRLVDEFDIWSVPGQGTRVTVTNWK